MMTASPPHKLFRANEVGPMIGVSGSTVRRWVREGLVKPTFTTPGGQYRFSEADLREQVAALGVTGWNPADHRKDSA